MTIDEAFHRVLSGHWRLIMVCLVLPVAAVLYLGGQQPALYQAVGRLQFGSTLASNNVEADAASTRALGIVTSPGVVQKALEEARLDVDPVRFALDHVKVTRVGVSPVIEVMVTHENPDKAALIDTSLINYLLTFSNSADRQAEIDRVKSLDASIADLTKRANALIPQLAKVTVNTPGAQLSLQAQLSGIQVALADNLQQRSNLIVAAASRPSTALLDPVRTPTVPVPDNTLQLAALAGLLGLIGGLGLAAALETLRPKLHNSKAISFAVGAPVIGHLDSGDLAAPRHAATMKRIADRMALLALRHDTALAVLAPVRVADQALAGQVAKALRPNGTAETSHRLHCVAMNGHWIEPGDHPAIVIFSPDRIRAHDLRPVQELIDSVDWPVLGVVTYKQRRWFELLAKADPAMDLGTAAPGVDPGKAAPAQVPAKAPGKAPARDTATDPVKAPAMPRQAMPRRAMPRRAMPRRAMPRRAMAPAMAPGASDSLTDAKADRRTG